MQVSWVPLRAIRASSRISSRYRPEQSRTQTGSSPRCSPAAGRAARATGPSPRHSSGCAVGAHEGAALFHPNAAARWGAAASATDDQERDPRGEPRHCAGGFKGAAGCLRGSSSEWIASKVGMSRSLNAWFDHLTISTFVRCVEAPAATPSKPRLKSPTDPTPHPGHA